MTDSQLPRGIRNNNPLNIRISNAQWLGKEKPSRDPDFESFVHIHYGIRAALINIRTHVRRAKLDGGLTLEQLINIWAPAADHNNPDNYVREVCRLANLSPKWKIDFNDRNRIIAMTWAMAKVECGQALKYQLFEDAYNML